MTYSDSLVCDWSRIYETWLFCKILYNFARGWAPCNQITEKILSIIYTTKMKLINFKLLDNNKT